MSYRKTLKLLCGFAGGSAVLVFAADSRGYFGERRGDSAGRWSRFAVLQAAQPAWTPASHTPAPTGQSWDFNWDKRDPSALSNGKKKETATEDPSSEQDNGKPKATRNILLIRHSQYNLSGASDKERILTPLGPDFPVMSPNGSLENHSSQTESQLHTDSVPQQPLSACPQFYPQVPRSFLAFVMTAVFSPPPGREQAEFTGKRLADLGLKYDVLVHSSMARATETAHIISKHLPGVELLSCDLLREGAPIEPVPPVTHWKPDAVYHEDGARIEAAFRRYIHRADPKQKEDSYEIIVCHANVIRYFVCRALQFPPEGWLRIGLNNGSITWLTIRPSGRVALRTLGDAGFMPPDKLTRT